MAEYREYISALRQCAKEHENENLFTGQIDTTALCNDTARLLENDVIERSKVDKIIEEMEYFKENVACTEDLYAQSCVDYCIAIHMRNIGEDV